jgi:hypothetical protein
MPAVNGGLKEIMPANFDGNHKNTKQFTQKFALYHMINQDSATMRNAYTRTALALSFMRGPSINDWVMQQTENLYLKCNGDMARGLILTYPINNEWLWTEFGKDFRHAFADMASEQ